MSAEAGSLRAGRLLDDIEIKVDEVVRIKRADVAWIGIAAFVGAYDYWAIRNGHETLSRAYWRALKNPRTRWPAILVVTGLYKHLVFPEFLPKLDPLYYVAERWHKGASR
jgi:hypothetical protein